MNAADKGNGKAGTLHLIDAENLAGDPYARRDTTLEVLLKFSRIADYSDGDLAYLAGNRYLLDPVIFDLPLTARSRHASGPDGADKVLLADAPTDWVCRRFRRLVVGSGDHIFAGLAEAALRAGLAVTIVGRPGGIARVYFELGCDVRTLDDLPSPSAPLANEGAATAEEAA
jgi:hypothetical protein